MVHAQISLIGYTLIKGFIPVTKAISDSDLD